MHFTLSHWKINIKLHIPKIKHLLLFIYTTDIWMQLSMYKWLSLGCFFSLHLVLLPPEGTSFCESSLATCWLAQHSGAPHTEHDCLRMAEYSCDLVAAWTFNIHEVGVG